MGGYRIKRQTEDFGDFLRQWRMVLGLTMQQVCERADIGRATLRKIEQGDSTVAFSSVLQVLRALGILDQVVNVVDPLNSDLGRLRAHMITRKRARPETRHDPWA